MRRPAIIIALVLVLPSVFANDQGSEKRRIPAHTPEWTNSNDSDPGATTPMRVQGIPTEPAESVIPELQSVVVLCATKPNSPELADVWSSYLQHHYDENTNLDQLISTVISRANAHRQNQHSRSGKQTFSRQQRNQIEEFLHDTAKPIIQNVR